MGRFIPPLQILQSLKGNELNSHPRDIATNGVVLNHITPYAIITNDPIWSFWRP